MDDNEYPPLQHRPQSKRQRTNSVASSQPYADRQRQYRPMPNGPIPHARLTVEQQLTKFIGSKFAFVILGFSALGYESVEALEEAFRQDLALNIEEQGGPQNVVVVGGATQVGVGHLYEIAKKMGVETLGIVSEVVLQGDDKISESCDHTIFVPDPQGTWDVLNPTGESYTVIAALINRIFGGLGGELFSYGGGEVAGREVMAAERNGVPFTVYPWMRPNAAKAEARRAAHDQKQAQRAEKNRVAFDPTPLATLFGDRADADGRFRSPR